MDFFFAFAGEGELRDCSCFDPSGEARGRALTAAFGIGCFRFDFRITNDSRPKLRAVLGSILGVNLVLRAYP